MDLDFQGRRMWYIGQKDSIYVVVRPAERPFRSGGRYIADLYIRRPGMTRGPISRLDESCFPAGQP